MNMLESTETLTSMSDEDAELLWVRLPLTACRMMRDSLLITEEEYLANPRIQFEKPLEFFIYNTLDELEKSIAASHRFARLLGEGGDPSALNGRVYYNGLEDEISLWKRKIAELIIDTHLLAKCGDNKASYLLHWYALKAIEGGYKERADLRDFYDCDQTDPPGVEESLTQTVEEIEKNLDLQRAWYLEVARPFRRSRPRFSSHRKRMLVALPTLPLNERLVLSMSYHMGYGHQSSQIHPLRSHSTVTVEELKGSIRTIGLEVECVLVNCEELLAVPLDWPMTVIRSAILNGNDAFNRLAKPSYEERDFVTMVGILWQIKSIVDTKFGYSKVIVEMLPRLPGNRFTRTFPSWWLKKFLSYQQVKDQLTETAKHTPLAAIAKAMSEDEFDELLCLRAVQLYSDLMRNLASTMAKA